MTNKKYYSNVEINCNSNIVYEIYNLSEKLDSDMLYKYSVIDESKLNTITSTSCSTTADNLIYLGEINIKYYTNVKATGKINYGNEFKIWSSPQDVSLVSDVIYEVYLKNEKYKTEIVNENGAYIVYGSNLIYGEDLSNE